MGVYIFFNWMNIEIQIQVFEGSICLYIYGCHLFIYSTSVADSTVGQAFPPVLVSDGQAKSVLPDCLLS